MQKGFGPGEKFFENMILRYDSEISYVDQSIRNLFKTLENNNQLSNTLIIITSDHGEEFLEHNYIEHSWTLYQESIHIPLIIWTADLVPQTIQSPVSTLDIAPTLLNLLQLNHKKKDLEGSALFNIKQDGFYFSASNKPIISELLIQHRNLVRSIIKDNWKYLSAQKWLPPRDRPKALVGIEDFEKNKKLHLNIWGPIIHEELFDLNTDPEEKHNLFQKNTQQYREMKRILIEYHKFCSKKSLRKTHRGRKLDPETKKKLESLGYL
jgi:arylsulfatase A-like enzyme